MSKRLKPGRPANPRELMSQKEIRELLVLREWTREELASRLGVTRNFIDRWFCVREDQRRHPSAELVQKMRAWLEEAREEVRRQPA
jgi:transcriptional regulator with XRE-family HTH domain